MEALSAYKLGEDIKIRSIDSTCLIASKPSYIYIFNMTTGVMLWQRRVEGLISHVSSSSDCNYIAIGTQQTPKVYFFDKKGNLEWDYELVGDVNQLAISRDGASVVVGYGYPKSKVYFLDKDGHLINKYEYEKIETSINSISISFDGSYTIIATGYRDPRITFFDNRGNIKWKYDVESKKIPVSGISKTYISQDGEFGVAVADNKAYFFNDQGILYQYERDFYIKSVALASRRAFAALGTIDGELSFFNETGRVWNYKKNHSIDILKISPDGNFLLAGSFDKDVGLFNHTGQVQWAKEFKESYIINVVLAGESVLIHNKGYFGENISLVDKNGAVVWGYNIRPDKSKSIGRVENILVFNETAFIVIKTGDGIRFFQL